MAALSIQLKIPILGSLSAFTACSLVFVRLHSLQIPLPKN
jgi:hypothetical protein